MNTQKNGRRRILSTGSLPLIILAFLSMVLFAGCMTPEKTVENFPKASMQGNSSKAMTYLSKDLKEKMEDAGVDWDDMPMASDDDFDKEEFKEECEKLVSSVDGDRAKVWHSDSKYMKIILVKEGFAWKIDDFEVLGMGFADSLEFSVRNEEGFSLKSRVIINVRL